MRKILFLSTAIIILLSSCKKEKTPTTSVVPASSGGIDFRQDMRDFVMRIAQTARQTNPKFIVIPQNGHELCTTDGLTNGPKATEYLNAIDGQGREELFFGYDNEDNATTPADIQITWLDFLREIRNAGKKILVTDYCSSSQQVNESLTFNANEDFVSFAADTRDLYSIPLNPQPIAGENNLEIDSLSQIRNFLYIINTQNFETKAAFINAVTNTNYDCIIMDAFFNDEYYTSAETEQLKQKLNGGKRLVIAYMSIGEAEDYRFYWKPWWSFNPPDWMAALNPDWPGNYEVQYWNEEWQSIICGQENSYLSKILDAGFDGTYLDIIDGYEYWEN
jgi:cysteinyl-tRNA synthetase, unknown class